MDPIRVSRHVAAPPERVFALASDFPNAPEHVDAIVRVEMLTDGPVGVGTRFRETRVMFKKEASEEMEVVEFEPPSRYVVTADSHGARYRTTFSFEPEQGGTRVSFEFQAEPYTMAAKLMAKTMGKLMMGSIVKCVEQDLDDIKAHAESDAASGEAAAGA